MLEGHVYCRYYNSTTNFCPRGQVQFTLQNIWLYSKLKVEACSITPGVFTFLVLHKYTVFLNIPFVIRQVHGNCTRIVLYCRRNPLYRIYLSVLQFTFIIYYKCKYIIVYIAVILLLIGSYLFGIMQMIQRNTYLEWPALFRMLTQFFF